MIVQPPEENTNASAAAEPRSTDSDGGESPEVERPREPLSSFRHRIKGLDRRAESIRNLVAVLAGLATILGVLHSQGLIEMAWPPLHLARSKSEPVSVAAPIDPPQARLGDVRVTHRFSLGTGCIEKQWDCSKFSESDYGRLGMLITFKLDTRNTSGSTLEVVWRLMRQNADPQAVSSEVAAGPGWPRSTFPIVSMEESGEGQLWIPYPALDGHFFAELQVVGMPDGSSDTINSSTFELPLPAGATPGVPRLQAMPTAAGQGEQS